MSEAMPPLSQYVFMAWCSAKEITGFTLKAVPTAITQVIRTNLKPT
jgi:hypothetical protein